jgi:hypothetical protein
MGSLECSEALSLSSCWVPGSAVTLVEMARTQRNGQTSAAALKPSAPEWLDAIQ